MLEESTPRTAVWLVARGKARGRAGFKTAAPTHIAEHIDLDSYITPLHHAEFERDVAMLLPDIQIGRSGLDGDCTFGSSPMSRQKFLDIASHLLGGAHGGHVTGYTFRRWLPSVAGALELPLERRRDLGNWSDVVAEDPSQRVKEPMSVRYSQARLAATAQVKRVCLAAVMHLYRWASRDSIPVTFEHLAGCIKSLDCLEARARQASWGRVQAVAEPPSEVPLVADPLEEQDAATEMSDSSSASSSSSSCEEGQDEQSLCKFIPADLIDSIDWIAPLRSKKLHVRKYGSVTDEAAALCTGRCYAVGYTLGTGVAAAAATKRLWCGPCLERLGQQVRA